MERDRVLSGPLGERRFCRSTLTGGDSIVLLLLAPPRFPRARLFHCILRFAFAAPRLLQRADLLLLLFPVLNQTFAVLRLHLLERVVVSLVLDELQIIEVDDFFAHAVQEILVVAHHQQSFLPSLQIVVQPNDSIEIEVIGRLIQHQQSRLHEKRSRQRYPHPPASAEMFRGLDLHVFVEAQAVQDPPRFGLRQIRPERCQRFVNLQQLIVQFIVFRVFHQRPFQPPLF
mmetsp:Transcript_8369/g.11761  ORF Transcript_8369/g.11761 Transcript_8369/m.11761 type:complete len:229 (+) Transcript_8369:66-752(+)